ncbi:hypothetical protein GGS21DRAFT_487917 [Xylaria nigripes]|nr:hypothetical protein GGS21DRAFT_487917 [Xylaria nigripes]
MSQYKLKGISSLSFQLGEKKEAEVEGIEGAKVLLLNAGGQIQALGPKCTHYGAPLVNGVLTKSGRLVCPWHGACFNAKTGDIEDAPALDELAVFKVAEKDGTVYVYGDEATIKSGRRKPNVKCLLSSSSDSDRVLVVGGGSGTIAAVEALRAGGFSGPITVISREGYLPIDRTKLSKALLTDVQKAQWRDAEFFQSACIDFVNDEVIGVDLGRKFVTARSSATHAYGKLILATGGTPRTLPLQGFKTLANIFVLRTLDDARNIVTAIGEKGKKIVIVGSSFIGMELANCTAAGNDVSVIGMESAPLERVLGKEVGAGLQKGLEAKGVKFYMSAAVDKAESSGAHPSRVGSVLLKDGTKLEADLVILGVGVVPATEFLKDNKDVRLEQDGSLKVDASFLVTGLKDVYAIGDIATYPYNGPGGQGSYTRIEHWDVAQNQGRSVAKHILNPSTEARYFTPVFWSALAGQLRYCGSTVNGWDDLVLQGSPAEAKFVAYYCKGDTVVAVASMGKDPAMTKSAELMREGAMPSKGQLQKGFDILDVSLVA